MANIINEITDSLININWVSASDLSAYPDLSANIKSWLTEASLLTMRLKNCAQHFELRVLSEGYRKTPSLLKDLEISDRVFIREVMLLSDGVPMILGQTSIPEKTLRRHHWLSKLGTGALGEKIMAFSNVQRSAFIFSFCTGSSPILKKHGIDCKTKEGEGLWMRRSSFVIQNQPLWVAEIFLPKIKEL